MKAEEIKKAIQAKKAEKKKAVEEAEILGVKGWLYRSSSIAMESWRSYTNATKPDGSPDDERRNLSPAKLVQISFKDEDGNKVFDDTDLAFIGTMDDMDVNRVFKRCLAINGYGGEGIEAILKNLVAIVGTDGVYASLVNIGCPCPNCSKDTQPTSSASSGSVSSTGRSEQRQKAIGPSSPGK
jgi:hypothetical protein